MISITQSQNHKLSQRRRRGFTLVEVLITTVLSSIILGAVISVAIFINRSSYRAAAYAEMDMQSRRGLEMFARDTRMAGEIAWNSTTSLTLSVPINSGGTIEKYRYTYDSTRKTFTRQLVSPATGSIDVLISGISEFEFKGFQIDGAELSLSDLTAAANRTKQIQLSLKATRVATTAVESTTKVLSARFILRNKHVTI